MQTMIPKYFCHTYEIYMICELKSWALHCQSDSRYNHFCESRALLYRFSVFHLRHPEAQVLQTQVHLVPLQNRTRFVSLIF